MQVVSMWILILLFMFLAGDVLGYLLEVLFRRFFTAKKWVNPGFMKGPWLPLYGFGLVLLFTLTSVILLSLKDFSFYDPFKIYKSEGSGPSVFDLLPIVITTVSLIFLEFIAGLIFIKGFKVRLWDYTNMRGNILGVICPLFSFFWFVISILYYYLLHPTVSLFFTNLYNFIFTSDGTTHHFFIILFLGVIYGVMLYDFISSLGVFNKVVTVAKKSNLLIKYEKFVAEQKENLSKSKKRFLATFFNLDDVSKEKEKSTLKEEVTHSKFYNKLLSIIFIDPELNKKPVDNYDEHGRPKSF